MTANHWPRRIKIIVNPAAGQPRPILRVLHEELNQNELEWHVDVTTDLGEVESFIDEAKAREVDLVAVYGGDGTVSAAAAALQGTELPLAILPGGTGNVMACELNIPQDLRQACRLLLDQPSACLVDMGKVANRPFILRVGIGLEAEMVNQAEPGQKSQLGSLAYALSGLAALQNPQSSLFQVEVDGQLFQERAVTCLVINSGNLGRPGLQLAPQMKVDDGLLDVVLIRQVDLDSIMELLASVVGSPRAGQSFMHWQGKRIRIEADPPRRAEADGEPIGQTPFQFELMPSKIKLIQGGRQGAV